MACYYRSQLYLLPGQRTSHGQLRVAAIAAEELLVLQLPQWPSWRFARKLTSFYA